MKNKNMARIISQPETLCFSSCIEDIVFGTDDASGTVLLEMTVGEDTTTLFNETMYASSGRIVLGSLSELLEPYARISLQLTISCTFTDDHGSVGIDPVTVLYANVDVDMDASDFTTEHFLTILNGEKLTAYGRKEYISAYNADTLTVTASVQAANGVITTQTATLQAMASSGDISLFDVSPANISALLALTTSVVLDYTLTAGYRVQNFRVIVDDIPPAPSLLFINSFGCMEFLHCVGKHKKESKYERQSARILGRLRNYRITEDRQFTANTGWLNQAMADWADDLFRSDAVYLWVDGQRGRDVVISDSKSEITDEDGNMPAFEFTYTYAQRIHNVMQTGHAWRIFDNTFDHTFN